MNEHSKYEVEQAETDLHNLGVLNPRFMKAVRKFERQARDKELMRRAFLGKKSQ